MRTLSADTGGTVHIIFAKETYDTSKKYRFSVGIILTKMWALCSLFFHMQATKKVSPHHYHFPSGFLSKIFNHVSFERSLCLQASQALATFMSKNNHQWTIWRRPESLNLCPKSHRLSACHAAFCQERAIVTVEFLRSILCTDALRTSFSCYIYLPAHHTLDTK